MSLQMLAARRAFRGLTSKHVDKLPAALSLRWPKPKPTKVAEKVLWIMKSLLPEETDDELKAVLQRWREGAAESPWASSLKPEHADMAEQVLDKNEAAELRAAVTERQAKKSLGTHRRASQVAQASAQGSSSSTAAASSSSRARKKQVPFDDLDIVAIRPLMPKVAGASISKDKVRHMRWQACYPTTVPPRSFSAVWNERRSEKTAVKLCLEWAWKAHFEQAGVECPYEFLAE